jgi:hypothetical protein
MIKNIVESYNCKKCGQRVYIQMGEHIPDGNLCFDCYVGRKLVKRYYSLTRPKKEEE